LRFHLSGRGEKRAKPVRIMNHDGSPPTKKLASVFGWTGLAKLVSQGASFVTMLVLVRLLDKSDFGLFSIVLLYTVLIDNITDFGLQSALIQRKTVDQATLSSVYWILLAASFAIIAATVISTPLVAEFFTNKGLVDTIRLASLAFVLVPSTIVGTALLSRDLRLESIAKIELTACIARCCISIGCAYAGLGVYSLVFGYLLERVVLGILLPREAGWWPRLVIDTQSVKELWAFGLNVTASRLLWFGYTRVDSIIVGRVLGVEVLGLYSIAYQIAMAFSQFISSVYYRVMFPILARTEGPTLFAETFLKSSVALTFLTLPVMILIGMLSDELVDCSLGNQWRDAVPILRALAAVAVCQTLAGLLPQAMNAAGRADVGVWINLLSLLLLGLGGYAGARWFGLEGVLVALLVVSPVRYLGAIVGVCRIFSIPIRRFVSVHARPYGAALVLITSVYVFTGWGHNLTAPWRGSIACLVGLLAYVVTSAFQYRREALTIVAAYRNVLRKE
jgi:teichuronic acid exporter